MLKDSEHLPELAIVPPLIGPFVEPTGLTGKTDSGTHLGVALWWSSALGSMRGDVVRKADSNYWREHLGFAQWPEFEFDDVFDALFFERTPRLFDFLNEFGEYIRVIEHSTLHSKAEEWLNPELVQRGFSLGHARAHARGVTVPLVWVFRRNVKSRWLGMPYVGVDYLEWSSAGTELRRGDYVACGGFASNALLRFAEACGAVPGFRWLTAEGEKRMRTLFNVAAETRAAEGNRKTNRRSRDEIAILAKARRALRRGIPLECVSVTEVRTLGDNASLSLLRSGIAARDDKFCSFLLSSRGGCIGDHVPLLQSCLAAKLYTSAETLLRLAPPSSGRFDAEYSHVLRYAAQTGDMETVRWALRSSPLVNARILEHALQAASQAGHSAIVAILLSASETERVASEAMLLAFRSNLFCQEWEAAERWLDLGLRPLSVETSEPVGLHDVVRPGGLSLLKRIFAVEAPTDVNLRKVIPGCVHMGPEADYVIGLSRVVAGHCERMSELLLHEIISFILWGHEHSRQLIPYAVQEGGTLQMKPEEFSSRSDLLRGHEWQKRQDRLITVVGELQKAGFGEEAKIVASLKRGQTNRRKRLASTP